MDWRIDEAVIRGHIDNRVRGRVNGRIWFIGRSEPVELELTGNCWRDLAGRCLEFTHRQAKPGDLDQLAGLQQGTVGDITASRKVKVPDIPLDEIGAYYAAKKPWPWHWGNCLYLEWFSERNGRVVIESADFELKIVGDPAWEMSDTEEEEQRRANAGAMGAFLERAGEAVARDRGQEQEPEEWDERPETEAEAEARQARSDRLAERVEARLRREGEDAYERILDEEIERMRQECGDPEPTPEQLARNAEWMEEINRAGEEALADPDPELEKELGFEHPLVERVMEFSLQLRETAETEGWQPEDATPEHPVAELLAATMIAGPKLAGALNGRDWPPGVEWCAHTIVRLKRARGYLEDALRATESCSEDMLIKPERLGPIVVELVDFIRETDELIAELRAKLERGTD
ncbi:MAG TPA: hypothetical protein VG734_04565 [Lacunisphaera sp.]|nr:hypothetical protein [Lacunisphaera sp.]